VKLISMSVLLSHATTMAVVLICLKAIVASVPQVNKNSNQTPRSKMRIVGKVRVYNATSP